MTLTLTPTSRFYTGSRQIPPTPTDASEHVRVCFSKAASTTTFSAASVARAPPTGRSTNTSSTFTVAVIFSGKKAHRTLRNSTSTRISVMGICGRMRSSPFLTRPARLRRRRCIFGSNAMVRTWDCSRSSNRSMRNSLAVTGSTPAARFTRPSTSRRRSRRRSTRASTASYCVKMNPTPTSSTSRQTSTLSTLIALPTSPTR